MDGITQALTAIQPEIKAGTEVAGLGSTAYNLYNQYQQQQYQNQLRSMAQDPTKMNAYAAKFTQPLTAGLQKGVANEAQGYLASRGLSDSPQISEQVEAQAIAPYIQQNQQQGYQNALQALQVGGGAINPALQQANGLSALTKAFSQLKAPGSSPSPATLQDYLRTFGTQPQQLDPSQWNPGAAPPGPTYAPPFTVPVTPLPAGQFPFQAGVTVFSKDYSNPRIYTTNVGYEQEIASGWAGYVDLTISKGVRLTRFTNPNVCCSSANLKPPASRSGPAPPPSVNSAGSAPS